MTNEQQQVELNKVLAFKRQGNHRAARQTMNALIYNVVMDGIADRNKSVEKSTVNLNGTPHTCTATDYGNVKIFDFNQN